MRAVERQFGPISRAVIETVLAKYGLPPDQEPWRSGSFSDVYEINTGQFAGMLLRLTCVKANDPDSVYGMFHNTRAAAEFAGDLMPERYVLEIHNIDRRSAIFESVIERLNAVYMDQWLYKFASPKALMRELLMAGHTLHQRGVVHRDISQNNVLLAYRPRLGKYQFLFIDSDDACVLPVGMTCSQTLYGTPGFLLPEVERSFDAKLGTSKIDLAQGLGKSKAYDGTPLYTYSATMLLHNMVHAMIMLGFAAVTRVNAYRLIAELPALDIGVQWRQFLARACLLETGNRFTFNTALQAVEQLPEQIEELGTDPNVSEANMRDFQVLGNSFEAAKLGSLGSLERHMLSRRSLAPRAPAPPSLEPISSGPFGQFDNGSPASVHSPPVVLDSMDEYIQQNLASRRPRTPVRTPVRGLQPVLNKRRRVTAASSGVSSAYKSRAS